MEARFDVACSALGVEVRLPEMVGAGLKEGGLRAVATRDARVVARDGQETAIAGLLAASDVVTGLNQIGVAMAQGEIAAVAIHNRLRLAEGLVVG